MAENININIENGSAPQQNAVRRHLPENRNFIKTVLLTLVTLGIYAFVLQYKAVDELNLLAHDGKKTMNYLLIFIINLILAPVALGIPMLVWCHMYYTRVSNELCRRGIDYKFGAGTFWGWNILGILILVGPIVFLVKWLKALNLLNADYNERG